MQRGFGAGMKGIFVSYRAYVAKGGGGVQICTDEYVKLIKAAGISLEYCLFEGDRRLSTRLARRILTSPYFRPAEPDVPSRIAATARANGSEFIFLNQVALTALAPKIKQLLPSSIIVALSHGLESTDFLHSVRLRSKLPITFRCRPAANLVLGDMIIKEARYRFATDAVCTLSSFDADLERWLGSPRVCWMPRSINPAPLNWEPLGTRLGFVGTLDHSPNLEGLVQVLDCFAMRNLGEARVRIISGSDRIGRWITKKYPFVDYLGPLDDYALQQEASTWNAFLHPIFCLPRGCSTKLTTALNWQLPVVTTTPGCRGYAWKEGNFVIAENARAFAEASLKLLDLHEARLARSSIIALSNSSPRIGDNAKGFMDFLSFASDPGVEKASLREPVSTAIL